MTPHESELKRIEELRRYQIIDTAEEREFNDIVELAVLVCQAPMALISFVDGDRQWFKAKIGFSVHETSRKVSFCSYAIQQNSYLIVNDAKLDPRFRENPLVTHAPGIRFYAGVPLFSNRGYALGTLCVLDTVPRTLSKTQERGLQDLARLVVSQLEYRLVRAERKTLLQEAKVLSNLAVLGQMTAAIAHEVANPLSVVHGRVRSLRKEVADGVLDHDSLETSLEKAAGSVDRVIKIIDGLKNLTRSSNPVELKNIKIRDLVNETLLFCSGRLQKYGVQLIVGELPDGLSVRCHSVQISQVLLNLINNAIDETSTLPDKWIKVEVRKGALSQVELDVTDSGSGIPIEYRDRIFSPFFSTKKQRGGTGLGLSISKKIVEAHGGTLSMDEACAHTRFVVKLPDCSS